MRPGETEPRGGVKAVVFAEINSEAVGVEQLGHSRDGGLESVRKRELRDRLAHDREQRARTLELEREPAGAGAGPQCMRCANAEGRED